MKPLSLFLKISRFSVLAPLLALALFSVVGCAKSEQERTVTAAAKRYGKIKVGMTKAEVVARLGEPASRQEFRYRWETAGGRDFNASLEVRFDNTDKVRSVEHSRASAD